MLNKILKKIVFEWSLKKGYIHPNTFKQPLQREMCVVWLYEEKKKTRIDMQREKENLSLLSTPTAPVKEEAF